MNTSELHVVTGAFGYTGKYITRRLLAKGVRVKTLTGHPDRENSFGDQVTVAPFNFDDPVALAESLRGATTLYNTYWVRFEHGDATFAKAVENTKTLIAAAGEAGVSRIVHVSITNPSPDSALPYFKGKALLEEAIIQSGLSYAIIRPTVIFGLEDILVNNIAWILRRFPVFAVPGGGGYRLQPIYVEDMADIAVSAGGRQRTPLSTRLARTFSRLTSWCAWSRRRPAAGPESSTCRRGWRFFSPGWSVWGWATWCSRATRLTG
jgi:NADH dehydrogenase